MYKVRYHSLKDNKSLEDFINKEFINGYELVSLTYLELGGLLIFKKMLE